MNKDFNINVISGVQAGKVYYTSNIYYKDLAKLIPEVDQTVDIDQRSQRELNKKRVKDITDYVLTNKEDYIFTSLIVSVDPKNKELDFKTIDNNPDNFNVGILTIPKEAEVLINDGQHRRAGIIEAILQDPELRDETVAIEIHLDIGLKRARQMFADINKNAKNPTGSTTKLMDSHDEIGNIVKAVIPKVDLFRGRTEYLKNTIPKNSNKLLTLNQIYKHCEELLRWQGDKDFENKVELLIDYWNTVTDCTPDLKNILSNKENPKNLREVKITGNQNFFYAMAMVGKNAIRTNQNWKEKLKGLSKLRFSKTVKMWQGSAVDENGRMAGTKNYIQAFADELMKQLDIKKYEKVEPKKLSALEEFIQTIKTGFKKDSSASYPVRHYQMKWEIVEHSKSHFKIDVKSLTGKAKGTVEEVIEMTNDKIEERLIDLQAKAKAEKTLEKQNENELAKKAKKELVK